MGISNEANDPATMKRYSVQFYDYDWIDLESFLIDREAIMEIFPYDCICYRTKHGVHFISFALLKGTAITKARSLALSRKLEAQDYWVKLRNLTLRVAPKYLKAKITRRYHEISSKPKFCKVMRKPIRNDLTISLRHLLFYEQHMHLPEEVSELYKDCIKKDYDIKLTLYSTSD